MRWTHVTLMATAVLAGCQEDPYQIRHYGDGGILTDGAVGDWVVMDGTTDARTEGTVHDLMEYDACLAMPEVCNNVDDNCNNKIDEGFNKLTDPLYCENCKGCMHLVQENAYPDCKQGTCTIKSCMTGFVNLDGKTSNGCEYECFNTGVEICDGIDNDCNGKVCTKDADCTGGGSCGKDGHCVDEGVTLTQKICKDLGPCKGATAVCKGSDGWQCVYGADVELQPCIVDADCGAGFTCVGNVCPGIVIVDEQKCDGKDGDCDGLPDDPWSNPALSTALGKNCDLDSTPKQGVCRNLGIYACDAGGAQVTCVKKSCSKDADCNDVNPGMTCTGNVCTPKAASSELCNGLDDNCDGTVDNNVVDEQIVTVGSGASAFKIFRFEASRPDATATSPGIDSAGRPCSVTSRLPWSNITKTAAHAACVRAGARLCSTAEWEQACKGSAGTLFPYGSTFDPAKCNGRAYDPAKDAPLQTHLPASCFGTWNGAKIFNMSGNVKEWTASAFSGTTPSGYEIKGGAYDTPSIGGYGAGLNCVYDLPAPSATLQIPTLGFRCCKD